MATTSQSSSTGEDPNVAEWPQLYEVATAFRDLAPWGWMEDWEYFGVEDPESGDVGYCYVTGALGEHFSLVVNLGEEGLHRSWEMRGAADLPEPDRTAAFFQQLALTASFEGRDLLTTRDRQVIKELGLKFRGRQAWPFFRSYRPNHPPWYLSAWEARFLATALREALSMVERVREDHSLLPDPRKQGQFLVRGVDAAGGTPGWKDEIRVPQPFSTRLRVAAPDRARVERLAADLPRTNGVVEFDCSILHDGVWGDEEDRPYFPALILAADAGSGMILRMEMVHPDAATEAIAEQFLNLLDTSRKLPARVVVQNDETSAVLSPVARRLGIRITRARRLPAIDAARSGLYDYLST
jgi:hypothetical protein